MDDVAHVVLALESPDVIDEVLHTSSIEAARVVDTACDDRRLVDAVEQQAPDRRSVRTPGRLVRPDRRPSRYGDLTHAGRAGG